jgi:DNA-binding MarR family transcriptional regulator
MVMDAAEAPTSDAELAAAFLDVTSPIRRVLRRALRRDLREGAVPQAQVELLGVVDRQPGIRVHEAAAILQLAANSVSTLVNRLVLTGLIRRERDPGDRRSVRLWVTPEAARVITARRAFRVEAVAAAIAALDSEDRRRIEEAMPSLRRLLDRLEQRA